jgi:Cu2+-containing amine oxidase
MATLCINSDVSYHKQSAICLHEEDAGLGWKHVDWRTGHTEVYTTLYTVSIYKRAHTLCIHTITIVR